MTSTKYDKTFDEMLEGKDFEGQNALEYLKCDFHDDELHQLDKQELINLFAKAYVLICLQDRQHLNLLKLNDRLEGLLQKHLEIYPDLKDAEKSDINFEKVKINAEIKNSQAQGFREMAKKLQQIKMKARASIPKSGGNARAENDEQHQSMEKVKKAYLEKWESGYSFPRGTLTVFYNEKANQYNLEFSSVKNSIESERKKLGHTKLKKQSS